MGHQICTHTGEVTAGLIRIALYHADGQVAFPHDAVAGAGDLGGQHFIKFVAVFIQPVIPVGQQDTALKFCFVDAAVINRDFGRGTGIEGIQQFGVIEEHGRLVLFARNGIVDVGERPRFGILVPDLKNSICKNSADGNGILYAARNPELLTFQLLRFRQGFNQAVSSLLCVFFFMGNPRFRLVPARIAGCMAL